MELKVIILVFVATKVVVVRSAVESTRQATPSQFLFAYGVDDDTTGNKFTHQQATNGEATQGEYRVALPDGRTQVVNYRADKSGYNAVVTYEGVAVHPEEGDEDEAAASNIVTRAPAPSTPHPSRRRPVSATPVSRSPVRSPSKSPQPVRKATNLPHLSRQFPLFPQSDLGIDVPILHDQDDLQTVDHPVPSLPPPRNIFPRRVPKFRRSKPVVPKPTIVPTNIPSHDRFDLPPHTSSGITSFPDNQRQQFPLERIPQFPQHQAQFPQHQVLFPQHQAQFPQLQAQFPQHQAQFNPVNQNLPDIHQQPVTLPQSHFHGVSDPFISNNIDLSNVFIDIPKINPEVPNEQSLSTTADLSLFVPEEDLVNGNLPGLVTTGVPFNQIPVNARGGFGFNQEQPLIFSVTPTLFPFNLVPDSVTAVRHHGTPVHEEIHLPPQPVLAIPQHGTQSPLRTPFIQHVSRPLLQGSSGLPGSQEHITFSPHHGISTPQQGTPIPQHVIDIPHHGTTVPIHDNSIHVTPQPDHGNPIDNHNTFLHDVTPTSFHHSGFRPSTPPFLFNQAPITPASHHVSSVTPQVSSVSRKGTPLPQITTPRPFLGNSFVQQRTPFPTVTSANPLHDNSVVQHGSPTPLISSPSPHISNPSPHHSGSFLHLTSPSAISSPVPHRSSFLHQGKSVPLISSPSPQVGSRRPLISSPAPLHDGSLSHPGTPVPLLTNPSPLHTGSLSRFGSPSPLLSTLAPQQENSFSHTGSPVPLISTHPPHTGGSSLPQRNDVPRISTAVPRPSNSFRGNPPLISSPAPHLTGSVSQLRNPVPIISSPAPQQGGLFIPSGTPVPQITSPIPHFGSPAPHFPDVSSPVTSALPFIPTSGTPAPPFLSTLGTPAPPFLPTTFRPSGSRRPFIPSPLENQVSQRPIQNTLRPKTERLTSSDNRLGRRRSNRPKTLAPFLPGAPTLDREQFLRHKGISARSVRSPLKKPKTKTKL